MNATWREHFPDYNMRMHAMSLAAQYWLKFDTELEIL